MGENQLGAFVKAFAELWGEERKTEELLEEVKLRWWNHISGVLAWLAFAVAVHLIVRDEAPAFGWLLLLWPQAWIAMRVARQYRARLLIQRASEIHWKDFDLRFQWNAFGLWDDDLSGLKRLWNPDLGLDYDSPAYRQWWERAAAHMRGERYPGP